MENSTLQYDEKEILTNKDRMYTYKEHEKVRLEDEDLDHIHQELVGEFRDILFYRVDGDYIRKNVDLDGTLGYNGGRYRYVPENEIWVEPRDPEDEFAVFCHEYIEMTQMTKHDMNYSDAHDFANTWELYIRREKSLKTFDEFTEFISTVVDDDGKVSDIPEEQKEKEGLKESVFDISDTVLLEVGTPPKELEAVIAEGVAHPKKDMIFINNDDFEVRFDLWGDTYRFNWIINRTGKYRGSDIFHALVTAVSLAYGDKPITTSAEKGYDEQAKKDLNGYYTMLRWGFIPDKGVKMLNALLGETYPTMEAAFKDPSFWKNWRDYGSSYTGVFDMTSGSLSWDLLEKKI